MQVVYSAGQEYPHTGMVEYIVPLRERLHAVLVLPRDLKAFEVQRLAVFLATLIDETEE